MGSLPPLSSSSSSTSLTSALSTLSASLSSALQMLKHNPDVSAELQKALHPDTTATAKEEEQQSPPLQAQSNDGTENVAAGVNEKQKKNDDDEAAAAASPPPRAAYAKHALLPDCQTLEQAAQVVDQLHELQLLLEPGSVMLADQFLGYVTTQCLLAAVEFRIPDLLESGPMTVSELATASSARPDRLGQILRVLRNEGIFNFSPGPASQTPVASTTPEKTESEEGTYSNNRVSTLLLSSHWTQWRNWVDLYSSEFYDMARGIPASCRAGTTRSAAQIVYDTDESMIKAFAQRGWLERVQRTLAGGALAQAPGIVEDYPWNEVEGAEKVLDLGGGKGGLLASLLRQYPGMRGGIFDLENVVQHAREAFHAPEGEFRDVGDRVKSEDLVAGDFLVEVPPCEVYTMKWCLHDWDDGKCVTVLENIRRAIIKGPRSRLVVLESILSDGRSGRMSRYADMNMMLAVGGQERDLNRWRDIAQRAGWNIRRVCHLRNAWPSAIEMVPDWDNALQNSNGSLPNLVASNSQIAVLKENPNAVNVSLSEATEKPEVESNMSFLEPWDKSKGEPFYRSAADEGFETVNFKWVEHTVKVNDARPNKNSFSLDKNGFAFLDHEEWNTDTLNAIRASEQDRVKELYYPEIEALLKKETGAQRVIIFDHTIRKRRPELETGQNPDGKEQPATTVHCDQSARGALRRLKQNLQGEELEQALKGRVRLINVWRPLRGPVEDWPLAMMDYRTAGPNIFPCSLYRHQYEDRGQTVTVCYGQEQKWFYLDRHETNEVTLIKIWDSLESVKAKLCPHAAFKHPQTPANVLPRESVEVRCFVLNDP